MGEIAIEPHEKRIRRITWLVLLAAIVALIAGGAIAWSVGGRMQMEAAIDATHARGWRATKSDFKPPAPIPDDQNAAFYLDRAGKAFEPSEQYKDAENYLHMDRLPLTNQEQKVLDGVISDNPLVFSDMRQARSLPRAVWNVPLSRMWGPFVKNSEFDRQRQLAVMLAHMALRYHQRRQDATAIQTLGDVWHIGESARSILPNVIGFLSGLDIEEIACAHARQLTEDLSPAAAANARALMVTVNDERAYTSGWIVAMEGKRLTAIEMMRPLTGKAIVGPYFQRQVAKVLWQSIPMADAILAPDWPAALNGLPPATKASSGTAGMLTAGDNRNVEFFYRGLTDRRATVLLIALRLYQLDHKGSFPAQLDDLVPKYLPAVPIDPMAAGENPFGYSGGNSADPYVYSVGENSKDDSASTKPIKPIPGIDIGPDIDPWQCQDAVFYFYRRPKPPPLNPPE